MTEAEPFDESCIVPLVFMNVGVIFLEKVVFTKLIIRKHEK